MSITITKTKIGFLAKNENGKVVATIPFSKMNYSRCEVNEGVRTVFYTKELNANGEFFMLRHEESKKVKSCNGFVESPSLSEFRAKELARVKEIDARIENWIAKQMELKRGKRFMAARTLDNNSMTHWMIKDKVLSPDEINDLFIWIRKNRG
ncbi:hypothetical protein N9137_02150 [Pseudomonadales bacterium]|nr:hypothetical protein [Pseudomonadales bacterium]